MSLGRTQHTSVQEVSPRLLVTTPHRASFGCTRDLSNPFPAMGNGCLQETNRARADTAQCGAQEVSPRLLLTTPHGTVRSLPAGGRASFGCVREFSNPFLAMGNGCLREPDVARVDAAQCDADEVPPQLLADLDGLNAEFAPPMPPQLLITTPHGTMRSLAARGSASSGCMREPNDTSLAVENECLRQPGADATLCGAPGVLLPTHEKARPRVKAGNRAGESNADACASLDCCDASPDSGVGIAWCWTAMAPPALPSSEQRPRSTSASSSVSASRAGSVKRPSRAGSKESNRTTETPSTYAAARLAMPMRLMPLSSLLSESTSPKVSTPKGLHTTSSHLHPDAFQRTARI